MYLPMMLPVLREEEAELAPKAKPSAKGRAKAKAQGKAKMEKPETKAAPMKRSRGKSNVEEEEDPATPRYEPVSDHGEDEEHVPTPKKMLFVSDDHGDHDDFHPTSMELDGKPRKARRVKKALDACMPEAHMAAKRQRSQSALKTVTGGSSGDKPEAAPKRRTQKPRVSKVDLSPFCKERKVTQEEGWGRYHEVAGDWRPPDAGHHASTHEECGGHEGWIWGQGVPDLQAQGRWVEPEIPAEWILEAACGGCQALCLGDGTIGKAPEVAYFGKAGTCSGGWECQLRFGVCCCVPDGFLAHVLGIDRGKASNLSQFSCMVYTQHMSVCLF